MIRSLQTPAGFSKSRGGGGGDRTVPTSPLIDGMIASSWSPLLRPHTGNQHQMATTPPSSLTCRLIYCPRRTSYYFSRRVPKQSDSIVSDHFTFFQCKSTCLVLFFSSLNNCLIKGCSWKFLSIPPEHLKALASWRPLIPSWLLSLHSLCSSLAACLSSHIPLLVKSYFLAATDLSQWRLNDRCFSGCEMPLRTPLCTPPPSDSLEACGVVGRSISRVTVPEPLQPV